MFLSVVLNVFKVDSPAGRHFRYDVWTDVIGWAGAAPPTLGDHSINKAWKAWKAWHVCRPLPVPNVCRQLINGSWTHLPLLTQNTFRIWLARVGHTTSIISSDCSQDLLTYIKIKMSSSGEVKQKDGPTPLPTFGRLMRNGEFLLDPSSIHINHGSWGSAPKRVFEARVRWVI